MGYNITRFRSNLELRNGLCDVKGCKNKARRAIYTSCIYSNRAILLCNDCYHKHCGYLMDNFYIGELQAINSMFNSFTTRQSISLGLSIPEHIPFKIKKRLKEYKIRK